MVSTVAIACPACGRESPGDARFCAACGARLGAGGRGRAERKAVSAVFVDLVDYTRRAELLDPEEARILLEGYWDSARDQLERFGGTVEKYIGDAVVGLFGAPAAHEDDAERAVRAALAIRDRARGTGAPELRIAVATGIALVRLEAEIERGEAMVVGDVVNTASRLQEAAQPGGVLVDEATWRATRDAVRYRRMRAVAVKGKREPVRAWEALAASTLPGVRPRSDSAFVGRAAELTLLRAALARVRRERTVQLVTLVGVPGIGKSRLAEELAREVSEEPEAAAWWQGRSLPYGDGVAFWALAEIVKAEAGIRESDGEAAAGAKLARLVGELLPDPEERAWVKRHARRLAGLADGDGAAAGDRLEGFAAWRRLLEAAAERRPLVLVLDDAQWADDGLLDFVEHLVEWAGPVPLLVLCISRPELLERRPGWGGGAANALTLSLAPLSDEETEALLAGTLCCAPDSETHADLLGRAGGNPLYAEQLARMVLERDGAQAAVPDSVQGVIAARLDTLPPAEKAVLQDAAVLGKVFPADALVALGNNADGLEAALRGLERKGLFRRSSTARDAGYSFGHRLVCDVAYGQVPRAARGEKHLRAARWLESRGRPDDNAELLAHHYMRAREYAVAAGLASEDLDARAREALARAAERALGLNAFVAARRLYESALDLWPAGDPARARILLRHAFALWTAEAGGEEAALEARDALLAAGDGECAAEAEALLGEMRWFHGDRAGSWEALDRAVSLVRERGDSRAKAHVLARLARQRMLAADADGAVEAGREALELAERLGLVELQAEALNSIGSARARAGDAGGLADVERAARLAPSSRAAVLAYNNLSALLLERGERARSQAYADKGRRLAERLGDRLHLAWFEAERAGRALEGDDWDAVLVWADTFLAAPERPRYLDASVRLAKTFVLNSRGRTAEALREIEQAERDARAAGDPQALVPGLAGCAFGRLLAGCTERAAALADEILDVCRAGGYLPPLCTFDLAVVLVALGRAGELDELLALAPADSLWVAAARAYAAGDLVQAAEIYDRTGSPWASAFTRRQAAEALAERGDAAAAASLLASARDYFESVGAVAELAACDAVAERLRAPSRA